MDLIIKNIFKSFDDFSAIKDLTLSIKKGQMVGFVGKNGAGKTTIFRMIMGLINPTSGTITYGKDENNVEFYDRVGYLPEERGLHSKYSVEKELRYLACLKGMSSTEYNKEIDFWLNEFQMTNLRKNKIDSLSKGNQQKIQLISSIIHRPELLILDEPFSGLDPIGVNLLKNVVQDLNSKGTTIIFSSHRMEHVEELCSEVYMIDKGEILISGSIIDIKKEYGDTQVVIESDLVLDGILKVKGIISKKKSTNKITLMLENESIAKEIYNEVIKLGYVKRFQIVEPSLNDIFIKKLGGKNEQIS